MTRDAKVGLLLGLFFIFIIAFLINGLPSLREHTNNNELTKNMVSFQNNPPGLGEKERKAQQVVGRMETHVEPEPTRKQALKTAQKTEADEQGVRFEMLLPESISVVKDVSAEKAADEVKLVAAATENKPGSIRQARPKTYIVVEDDNLAVIAKKCYGAEEGNKRKNIERLYEANRKELKSPDEIYVGQKLVIPALAIRASDNKIEGVFTKQNFEKVDSIGRRHISTTPPKTAKTKQSRVYTVREGDSLWKIAAEQLGNGGRYPEISKLNAGILEDEDTLTVGMRLRLPGR